jgi:ketosteroid isomerase-like protein
MHTHEALINRFYSNFQKLDYKGMNECYSEGIVFSDPAFGLLEGDEVRYMWEMLCTNAKDFSLTFSTIELLDDEYATCKWTAKYTFSKTGKKVVNYVKAYMRIKDGKIVEHSDAFKLSKWAAQALGWKGELFGWMNWFKSRITKNARKTLESFIISKKT